ncbi:MAG: hypothetical protein AB1700_13505 [Bacillota bacterium]
MDVLLDTNVIIDLIELGCLARVLEAGAFRFLPRRSLRVTSKPHPPQAR